MDGNRRTDQLVRDAVTVARSHAIGMWRFRWFALALAWTVCVVGWLAIYTMPDIYEANARVFVDTENAIDDFLGGIAVPSDVMSEVNVVVREIVSRPNLAEVARNTDIALRAQTDRQFADLLTSLQSRISVAGSREGVFSISFADADRDTALAVVQTLLNAFVEGSLGADRSDSAQAQEFLQLQIEGYEERLTQAEDKLASFKRENVALMPDQRTDYFTRLRESEAELRETQRALTLEQERRGELRRQLEGEEPVFGIMGTPGQSRSASTAKIRELEAQLEELRLQYTDKHPRIGQILDTIELLKSQEAERAAAAGGSVAAATSPLDLNPVYQNLRIQLSNVEVEIASLAAQRDQQRRLVEELRVAVDTMPRIEAELNRLNRDYDVVNSKHQQLLQQLETANIGEDVSRSIDEVQFRIIDPPYSPIEPVGPNRPVFMTAVLIAGMAAAFGLAFFMNQLKPTFIGNRSVSEVLHIPVLGSVSLLQSETQRGAERRSRHKLQAMAGLLMVTFVLAVMFADQGASLLRSLLGGVS